MLGVQFSFPLAPKVSQSLKLCAISANNPYLGGPNVTCPPYSHIPGGILGEETKTSASLHHDSSSSSESESSHSSSNHGKFESQHSSSRSSGIRMNKDEKLAREAGIKLQIKVSYESLLVHFIRSIKLLFNRYIPSKISF